MYDLFLSGNKYLTLLKLYNEARALASFENVQNL